MITFEPADARRDHAMLTQLNVEYLNWLDVNIRRDYQIDLDGLLGRSIPDYVAATLDGLCAPSPPEGVFYLVHSTLVTGGLFLLADLISRQRGVSDDRLDRAHATLQPALLGGLFFAAAIAIAGLPPASGFLTKVLMLRAALDSPHLVWFWGVVLGSGLLTIVSLARAGSALFWRTDGTPGAGERLRIVEFAPTVALVASAAVLVIVAAGMESFTAATAEQLFDPASYVEAVLANKGVSIPASALGANP